jgi:hypothetical protein
LSHFISPALSLDDCGYDDTSEFHYLHGVDKGTKQEQEEHALELPIPYMA